MFANNDTTITCFAKTDTNMTFFTNDNTKMTIQKLHFANNYTA